MANGTDIFSRFGRSFRLRALMQNKRPRNAGYDLAVAGGDARRPNLQSGIKIVL